MVLCLFSPGLLQVWDFVEVEEPSDGTILGRWCGLAVCQKADFSKEIKSGSDLYLMSIFLGAQGSASTTTLSCQ